MSKYMSKAYWISPTGFVHHLAKDEFHEGWSMKNLGIHKEDALKQGWIRIRTIPSGPSGHNPDAQVEVEGKTVNIRKTRNTILTLVPVNYKIVILPFGPSKWPFAEFRTKAAFKRSPLPRRPGVSVSGYRRR